MDPDALKLLIEGLLDIRTTRYFTLTGLVLLLWDHLLTFKDEIEYIWRLPLDLNKLIFFFNRYVVAGSLCLSVYLILDLRGPLSQKICYNTTLYLTCTSLFSVAVASLTVIFHIQTLWEKRPVITYVLSAVFIVTYSVTAVCSGLTLQDYLAHVVWIPEVNSCTIPHKPMPLIGFWAGMVTFDFFMLSLMFTNAVSRPYRENSEVIHNLHKDGMRFFVVLLLTRIAHLLITIIGTHKVILMAVFFGWAIVSVTLSRFLITLKASEEAALKEPAASGTEIVWRNDGGHWSRENNPIELKSTSSSIR